jgi:hypothetical protein
MIIKFLGATHQVTGSSYFLDADGMKTAIISQVARFGFGYGVLSVSHIMEAIHGFLTGRSDVSATTVSLQGKIYAPNGEVLWIGDNREIRILDLPSKQVTSRTTVFLTDISRIDISFTRVEDA